MLRKKWYEEKYSGKFQVFVSFDVQRDLTCVSFHVLSNYSYNLAISIPLNIHENKKKNEKKRLYEKAWFACYIRRLFFTMRLHRAIK